MRQIKIFAGIFLGMALCILPITSKAGSISLDNLTTTIESEINFKPSKDVTIKYGTNTNHSAYGAYDYHSKGTEAYATGSGMSKFYVFDCNGPCGTATITDPSFNDNGTVTSTSWKDTE